MSEPKAESNSTRTLRTSSDIREKIVGEISKSLNIDPASVDCSAPLDSIGVDSMNAIGIAGTLAEWMGRDLPASLMWDYATIDALAEGLADRPSAPVQKTWPGVVNLQPLGTRTPIFFFPGRGGHPVTFFPLAQHLGLDQPSYGLTLPGFDPSEKPCGSVEDMAGELIKTLRKVQSEGPYQLAGYSFGGMVAYEAARQLTASGQKVGLVAIYDISVPGGVIPRPRWQRLLLHLYILISRPNRLKYLAERIPLIGGGQSQEEVEPLSELNLVGEQKAHYHRFSRLNNGIADGFKPQPYSGTVVLFRSSEPSPHEIFFKVDPALGWGAVTGGRVRVVALPGSHDCILSAENAAKAAQALQPFFAQEAVSWVTNS